MLPGDEKGLAYKAEWIPGDCNVKGYLLSLFPDVAAISDCSMYGTCGAPMSALDTALFLTETSTSHEADTVPLFSVFPATQLDPATSPDVTVSGNTYTHQSSIIQSDHPRFHSTQTILTSFVSVSTDPAEAQSQTSTYIPAVPASSLHKPAISTIPPPLPSPPRPMTALQTPRQSAKLDATSRVPGVTVSSDDHSQTTITLSPLALGTTISSAISSAIPAATPVMVVISGSSTHFVVGTSTIHNPFNPFSVPSTALQPIVIGTDTISPNTASQYIISSQVYKPGDLVTLRPSSGNTPASVITLGSKPFVNPNSVITIGAGTSTTILTLQTSGSLTHLIIGSSTYKVPAVPASAAPVGPSPITIGTEVVTRNSASQYIVAGQTLLPGSSITIGSGTSTIVLALQTSNSGTELVIGTSIISILDVPIPTQPTGLAPITIGTQIITANAASQYVIGSQTLVPGGPAIILSGTRISLEPSVTALVVGTSTAGLGRYIISGLGGGNVTSTQGAVPLQGRAKTLNARMLWMYISAVIAFLLAIE